jgi:hypothetical protein
MALVLLTHPAHKGIAGRFDHRKESMMQVDPLQSMMADLRVAAAIQGEISGQRLLFEWCQTVIEQLRCAWEQIETLDTLAYEDKVSAQVRTLEEATSSLWHLHHSLVATRRLLKRHQHQLQPPRPRNTGKQLPTGVVAPNRR